MDLLFEAQDPATEGPPLEIRGLPAEWSEAPIEVDLLCRDMEFERGTDRGILIVQRSRASVPCVLRGKLRADVSGDKIEVVATFSYLGRFLGAARRSLSLSRAKQPRRRRMSWPMASFAAQELDLNAAAPELTVFVSAIGGQESLWKLWVRPDVRERCPKLPASLSDTVRTRLDWERFASRLRAEYTRIQSGGTDLADGEHMSLVMGLGRMIYEQIPAVFRETYWALRAGYGLNFAIQFICDDASIPWELMAPDREGESASLLALSHPVARWLTQYEGWMTHKLPRGGIVSVTPLYPPHRQLPALPGAQRESNRLGQLFPVRTVAATSADVLTLLREPEAEPVSILHFAGHGSFDEAMPLFSTLSLEDRDLRAAELRSVEVKLGERCRSLVIFNACNTGAVGAAGGTVSGWAEVFLHRRFGGFIAPLWGIHDGWAKSLTPELLTLVLKQGEPLGQALHRLRSQYGKDSLTYLSYVYYGDVMARFV